MSARGFSLLLQRLQDKCLRATLLLCILMDFNVRQ